MRPRPSGGGAHTRPTLAQRVFFPITFPPFLSPGVCAFFHFHLCVFPPAPLFWTLSKRVRETLKERACGNNTKTQGHPPLPPFCVTIKQKGNAGPPPRLHATTPKTTQTLSLSPLHQPLQKPFRQEPALGRHLECLTGAHIPPLDEAVIQHKPRTTYASSPISTLSPLWVSGGRACVPRERGGGVETRASKTWSEG